MILLSYCVPSSYIELDVIMIYSMHFATKQKQRVQRSSIYEEYLV